MALQKQYIPVNFLQGIDTKTDKKLVIQTKLLKLQNSRLQNGKVSKRNGYDSLGTNVQSSTGFSSLPGGEALGNFNSELLLFNKNSVYSQADFNSAYINKGQVVPVVVNNTTIIRNSYAQFNADFATLNGVTVYAYQDSRGGIRATVMDEGTGSVFQSDVSINTNATMPRCRAIGSYLFVFFVETTTNTVKFNRLSPGSPYSFVATQTLVTGLDPASRFYDLSLSGNNAAIWASAKNGGSIDIGYVDQFGSNTGYPANINLAEAATNCLSVLCNPTTQQAFIFFHNNTNGTRCKGYDNTLTSLFATATIEATTAPLTMNITAEFTDVNHLVVFYEVNNATPAKHFIKKNTLTTGGTAGTASVLKRGVGLASKAFVQDSVIYFHAIYPSYAPSFFQATYFTLDSSGNIIAKEQPSLSGYSTTLNLTQSYLPQVINTDSDKWEWLGVIKTGIDSNGTSFLSLSGISKISLDFGSPDRYFSAQIGQNLHIAGGFLSTYDGASIVEHGFHLFPEITSSSLTQGAGGSMADGAYQYTVIYSWVDNWGQKHRSAPSPAASITVSAGGGTASVAVVVPTLRLTAKTSPRGEVEVELYRTAASGNLFYRVKAAGTNYNDPTADSITITDTSVDASITASELLYTTGGILENIAPPACKYIVATKNRLWLGGLEDPNLFWYSKFFVLNEGIAFNDNFTKRTDSIGGDATGIFPMDDKVIFFKKNNLFYISGDGPLDTGEQDTFTDPQIIPTDVGLKDTNSLVLTDQGIMFKSSKGLYLLSRALEVQYIGADVEAYNENTIRSADLIANQNQVRFLSNDGPTLVYDTYYGQWKTFHNHEGVDALNYRGSYVYLRTDNGEVYQENIESAQDNNKHIEQLIETAWLKVGSIQNLQRVQRMILTGDFESDHKLEISIAYDYQDYFRDIVIWSPSDVIEVSTYGDEDLYGDDDVYGGVSDSVYQVRVHIPNQKCQAIKFRIRELPTTSEEFGRGFSISSMTIQAGMKEGVHKLRSEKSL